MATLFFINVPGQMTDTDFGIGEYFTGSFTLTVQPPDSVGLVDSGTGNSITIRVDLPLPANTNDAVVTSLDVRSSSGVVAMYNSSWLASSAGAPPLNGTCVISIPASVFNNSPVM